MSGAMPFGLTGQILITNAELALGTTHRQYERAVKDVAKAFGTGICFGTSVRHDGVMFSWYPTHPRYVVEDVTKVLVQAGFTEKTVAQILNGIDTVGVSIVRTPAVTSKANFEAHKDVLDFLVNYYHLKISVATEVLYRIYSLNYHLIHTHTY